MARRSVGRRVQPLQPHLQSAGLEVQCPICLPSSDEEMSPAGRVLALSAAALLSLPVAASAKDYAATALNVIPSGQWGGIGAPPASTDQARMYDGLTPLFDQVTDRRPDEVLQAGDLRHRRAVPVHRGEGAAGRRQNRP